MTNKLLPLVKAIEEATGYRPHLSTCIRWATIGSKGIFLKTVMLGGRRLTTVEDVETFIREKTIVATPVVRQTANSEAMEAAKVELARLLRRNR